MDSSTDVAAAAAAAADDDDDDDDDDDLGHAMASQNPASEVANDWFIVSDPEIHVWPWQNIHREPSV